MHDYLEALKSGRLAAPVSEPWRQDRRCAGWGSSRHRAVSLTEIAVDPARTPAAGHRKLGEAVVSEPVLERCEACGRRVPGYDTVILSSETKSRSRCSNCFNDTMAAWTVGLEYCSEWLAQFTEERPNCQVHFRRARAHFHFCLGEITKSEVTHSAPRAPFCSASPWAAFPASPPYPTPVP